MPARRSALSRRVSPELRVGISVVSISGSVIARVEVQPHDTCRVVKERVAAAGGPLPEHQTLLCQSEKLLDDMSVQDLGLPTSGTVELKLLSVAVAPQLRWSDDGMPSNAGHVSHFDTDDAFRSVFVRGNGWYVTNGVRADAPLPPYSNWYIQFDGIGTHVSIGVGTAASALEANSYENLFGSDEDSWALCFASDEIISMHGGRVAVVVGQAAIPRGKTATLTVLLRREHNRLMAILPGEVDERVVFDSLPLTTKLYPVAATCFGGGSIAMGHYEMPSGATDERNILERLH